MRTRFVIALAFTIPIFVWEPFGLYTPPPAPFGLRHDVWLFVLASAAILYPTHVLDLEIAHDVLAVSAAHCEIPSMKIGVRGEVHELAPGERRSFALAPALQASVLARPDAERT